MSQLYKSNAIYSQKHIHTRYREITGPNRKLCLLLSLAGTGCPLGQQSLPEVESEPVDLYAYQQKEIPDDDHIFIGQLFAIEENGVCILKLADDRINDRHNVEAHNEDIREPEEFQILSSDRYLREDNDKYRPEDPHLLPGGVAVCEQL